MLIRILRQTSISGRPARVGDLIEVVDSDARLLLGSGKAQLADPITSPEVEPTPPPRVRKPRTPRTNGRS